MDLNRITLLGNISKAPEQTTIASGAKVTKAHVATNYVWKDRKTGELKEKADFHTVIAWNKLGERMAEYLKKGDRVYIEGRLDNRSYEAKDGTTKYVTDIIANSMIMLGKGKREVVSNEEPATELTVEPV